MGESRPAEFELIERIRRRVHARGDVALGIGDDGAVLDVPAGHQLVVAMDTLNAGVHFPLDTAPADIGWKALAVNLSDLAAMGAEPAWCTLSLCMPKADVAWVDAFLDGFAELASRHGVALVGGDTTRGPLSICVTAHGFVEPGRALRRGAARAGDDVWVSGTLGDAAAGLRRVLDGDPAGASSNAAPVHARDRNRSGRENADASGAHGRCVHAASLIARLDRPTPRVALGRALASIAHACIDVSDGLLADLAHVAHASAVGIEIDVDRLPASTALQRLHVAEARRVFQATGGDDYELCFTTPPEFAARVEAAAREAATPVRRIGRVRAGEGVCAVDADGAPWTPLRAGHVHFA